MNQLLKMRKMKVKKKRLKAENINIKHFINLHDKKNK